MTEANDKLTALERALSELRHAQGAWQVNHLNLKFVAELNAAEDALIEAARAEGVQDGRSEAADLDVIEAYEKGLAEGRAAAANEHPTCATCGYYDQSSGMGTKWCERHLRYLPFAGTTTRPALPELLGCREHTPRAEEGEK